MNTFNITINIEYTNESVIKECKLKYCYHSKQKDNYFYEAELKKDKIIISGSRKSDLNFEFNDKVKNLLYYDILNLLIYNYLHNQPFSIASIELIKNNDQPKMLAEKDCDNLFFDFTREMCDEKLNAYKKDKDKFLTRNTETKQKAQDFIFLLYGFNNFASTITLKNELFEDEYYIKKAKQVLEYYAWVQNHLDVTYNKGRSMTEKEKRPGFSLYWFFEKKNILMI